MYPLPTSYVKTVVDLHLQLSCQLKVIYHRIKKIAMINVTFLYHCYLEFYIPVSNQSEVLLEYIILDILFLLMQILSHLKYLHYQPQLYEDVYHLLIPLEELSVFH
jgi:hypothetical protein